MPIDWDADGPHEAPPRKLTSKEITRLEHAAWRAQCEADIWAGIIEFWARVEDIEHIIAVQQRDRP